jgi:translation elongation factor EF-G
VQQLLDAVVNYLPSPLDVPPVPGINPDKIIEQQHISQCVDILRQVLRAL